MKASYRGNLPTVQLLISKQCIPDLKTTESWTALMFAAERGHTNVVKALGASWSKHDHPQWRCKLYIALSCIALHSGGNF